MQFSKFSVSLASACVLAGCSHNPLDYRPTMGADPSQIGLEALAHINTLQEAYTTRTVSGADVCLPLVPSYQHVDGEPYRRVKDAEENWRNVPGRLNCLTYKPAPKTAELRRHYAAGISLSNIYCDDYFRRIAKHKQKRQYNRSVVNDVGTAASAGLGLASAGSIATGAAGAAFGLADRLFTNYDRAFVVEPDLGKMLELVRKAQGQMKAQHDLAAMTTYAEAEDAVHEYAQLCSYAGMADLLDKAIETGLDDLTVTSAVTRFQSAESELRAAAEERRNAGVQRELKAIEERLEAQRKIDELRASDDEDE